MHFDIYIPVIVLSIFLWSLYIGGTLFFLAFGLAGGYNLYSKTPAYVSVIRAARAIHNGKPWLYAWQQELKDKDEMIKMLRDRLKEYDGGCFTIRIDYLGEGAVSATVVGSHFGTVSNGTIQDTLSALGKTMQESGYFGYRVVETVEKPTPPPESASGVRIGPA